MQSLVLSQSAAHQVCFLKVEGLTVLPNGICDARGDWAGSPGVLPWDIDIWSMVDVPFLGSWQRHSVFSPVLGTHMWVVLTPGFHKHSFILFIEKPASGLCKGLHSHLVELEVAEVGMT